MPKKRRARWYTRYPRRFHRRHKSKKIPLAPVVGALSTLVMPAPSGRTILNDIKNGDLNALLYDARERYAGVDANGNWHWDWVAQTYTPLIAGLVVHKVVNAIGANRVFNKIPLIGKYLSV